MRGKLVKLAALAAVAGALLLSPTAASARALFAYPLKGQSAAQEEKDRADCHNRATVFAGYEPTGVPEQTKGSKGAGKGAVIGGITGTIVGGIASGGAGAVVGLGVGAGSGGLIGGIIGSNRQKEIDAKYDAYLRAGQTCLEAKGYRVSR